MTALEHQQRALDPTEGRTLFGSAFVLQRAGYLRDIEDDSLNHPIKRWFSTSGGQDDMISSVEC